MNKIKILMKPNKKNACCLCCALNERCFGINGHLSQEAKCESYVDGKFVQNFDITDEQLTKISRIIGLIKHKKIKIKL